MRAKRFKRYLDGILYLIGNGKTIFFTDDKIKELHELIHEWEKNPKEIFNMRKKQEGDQHESTIAKEE